MKKPASISAILLAAGESKRMGAQKLLLPLGDRTILEHSVDNLLGSKVSEVIVVIGYRAEDILPLITARQVKIAKNPMYQQGMSTSIAAGLRLAGSSAVAVMLALADLPFILPGVINRLIGAFDSSGKGIVVPSHSGRRGHPVIISLKYREELVGLDGDVGAKDIIRRYQNDVCDVDIDDASIYTDINNLSSYQYFLKSREDILKA